MAQPGRQVQTKIKYFDDPGVPLVPMIIGGPEPGKPQPKVEIPTTITDVTGREDEFTLDVQGFHYVKHESQVTNWDDDEEIKRLNIFRTYFERSWPVLSCEHGLSWLGIAMIVMGCQVLANTTDPTFSAETIGLPLWRLILASGILAITFGFFNVISSIIFRDGHNGINARNIRSDGTLASGKNSFVDGYSVRSNSIRNEKQANKFKRFTQKFPAPWNKSNTTAAARPNISGPIIPDVEQGHASDSDRDWDEDRRSPIMPDINRPPTAMHPMNTGNTRFTKYSEASGMTRF
ncbi:hypothetical protein CH063_11758 [Colletotrichum higginsianum]|uniref:DUF7598 domain-containing protein n=1 Tax=Colletotrichum higginsianum (strain IMI 349063) TaxID=759273 RepID=H1VMP5_COLHI|nr:hypothetical protein CH063_11758 [Colletotrichum higginsianum]